MYGVLTKSARGFDDANDDSVSLGIYGSSPAPFVGAYGPIAGAADTSGHHYTQQGLSRITITIKIKIEFSRRSIPSTNMLLFVRQSRRFRYLKYCERACRQFICSLAGGGVLNVGGGSGDALGYVRLAPCWRRFVLATTRAGGACSVEATSFVIVAIALLLFQLSNSSIAFALFVFAFVFVAILDGSV